MIRIGIFGSENSHATAFSEIFNLQNHEEYRDIRVTMIGGHHLADSQAVQQKCQVERLAERPEEMLGQVDAVMVTTRDGQYHAEIAKMFIEAGVPLFIDKPFTRDPKEALELTRLAKAKGVPLAGGTSMKYAPELFTLMEAAKKGEIRGGDLAAPVSLVNEYGGFFFYASHLAEMTLKLFGPNPRRVMAYRLPESVTAVVRYDDYDVTNHFNAGCYHYSASIYQKEQTLFQELSVDQIYQGECANFAHMLRTGEMDQTYEELVRPVYYMAAVERSYETGTEQEIPEIIVR